MVYLNQLRNQTANEPNDQPSEPTEQPFSLKPYDYQTREPSRDGTGKVYMGREISKIMGHAAIDWLERPERDQEEATSQAVIGLELKPDAVVADIGSGSGYYTFRIARLVPEGKVIGVDIQPEMVAFLGQKAARLGVENVEAHLGKVDSVQLSAASVDAVILVDAYHEFSHPNEMMQSIMHALKPGGRVYLLEYRAEDPKVPIKPLHKMTEAQAVKEMQAVGLRHLRTESFLPWQHFMVFEK
ncbi:MAG: class I SAM-dependent methyltransferase [Verrucomicrobiae bacterium]|nr:class I SAM-dependent methyltransferase [Verrucomicrobiae bacterium]NNJ86582.1 class I SAM-dependent methyltransferase [Akkermansiaceae bacterium]